jgi:hypothetical protein
LIVFVVCTAIDWLTQQDDVAQIWNRLNCSGYKIPAKSTHIITVMYGMRIVEISETKEGVFKKFNVWYEQNRNSRLVQGINEFKKGYQSVTNLVKDDKHDLLADYHRIFNRWNNHICQVLHVLVVYHVRQTEVQILCPTS